MDKLTRTDAEWRAKLTPEQYRILREAGTEPPFSGELLDVKDEGEFRCAACGEPLFASGHKYDSGSGWPSFTRPKDPAKVSEQADASHGMTRTEVRCARCDGHLGHVFPDGPGPEGQRYCINSAALSFAREGDSGDDDAAGADDSDAA
ncbi:MAG TPA: peptide-methionine (R)-S-oxide reductase MsrB [Sphingomicrobium sp.]|nr:peptide-methionine (R)-S-oxide reductase MsrB [Sphingomicrobium sp.]